MPNTDLPVDDLRRFRANQAEPTDFDDFWSETLHLARSAKGPEPSLELEPSPFTELVVEDLVFPGWNGEPIHAWVTRPGGRIPRPTVVEFMGYGGGRGLPGDRIWWAAAGYVHVLMDTRGQGSAWGNGGVTPDPHGSDPAAAGYLTRGIRDRDTYYYRRVYADGVRLVDAVRMLPFVDPEQVSVTGGSQGGGIAIAVGGLVSGLSAVMPDVPFLCNFPRAIEITPKPPLTEITTYLGVHRTRTEEVLRTLAYFDGVFFARRISAPSIFSVALMDGVVMPSSVFAAYNELTVEDRAIEIYPFNGHEGGLSHQWHRQAGWLSSRVSSTRRQA